MTPAKPDSSPAQPRRPKWPFIIVGLLAAHVVGMAVAVAITERDRSFLVVPDYYNKSQHWDAERRLNAKLGWQVRINASPIVDTQGLRPVSFHLADANDRPVAPTHLEVTYFHHAHPDRQRKVVLTAGADDARQFIGAISMPETGTWEFHFAAESSDGTWTETKTEYVANGPVVR